MSRFCEPPVPLVLNRGPYTGGLRFFTFLRDGPLANGLVYPGNLVAGRGADTVPKAYDRTRSIAGYPGLKDTVTDTLAVFWDTSVIGTFTGSVSAIGRWKPASVGTAFAALIGTTAFAGAASGFFLSIHATDGPGFGVANANNFNSFGVGSGVGYFDREYTQGGSFDQSTGTVKLFADGVRLGTNTSLAQPWNTSNSGTLRSGTDGSGGLALRGSIFWIAVFNRCLTDNEMVAWTTGDPLDLIRDNRRIVAKAGTSPAADDVSWLQPDYYHRYVDV